MARQTQITKTRRTEREEEIDPETGTAGVDTRTPSGRKLPY